MRKAPQSIPKEEQQAPFVPAQTEEGRENQLISLAVNLAERQLREGTASSQVITHYLKLGSTKNKVEVELLKTQRDLALAKTEALKSSQRIEELYSAAMDALRSYNGSGGSTSE